MKSYTTTITVSDDAAEVIANFRENRELTDAYLRVIDELTDGLIQADAPNSAACAVLSRLRYLRMLRQDIVTLSCPPDETMPPEDAPMFQVGDE